MKAAGWRFPRWIAHRGAGLLAPENTLAAFRVGAAHGYRAFECDAKLSADGVPFLLHDATLDRTTSSRGVAGERPWGELSRLDAGGWHSRAYAGEPIPSLEAVVRYVQRNGFALNVEIKPTPGQLEATGAAVAEACARWWQDTEAPLLLTSFKPQALAAARDAAPDLPRGLLVDKRSGDDVIEAALELGCTAVVTDFPSLDAGLLARLRAAGLRAACYTINDPAEARRLAALGVDGIITDAVDRFAPADGDGVLD